jgi:hypothetical protein
MQPGRRAKFLATTGPSTVNAVITFQNVAEAITALYVCGIWPATTLRPPATTRAAWPPSRSDDSQPRGRAWARLPNSRDRDARRAQRARRLLAEQQHIQRDTHR